MTASSFTAGVGSLNERRARFNAAKSGNIPLMLAAMTAFIPIAFRCRTPAAKRPPRLNMGHTSPSFRCTVSYPERWGQRHHRRWRHKQDYPLST